MITIIYGDDIKTSREKFLHAKSQSKSPLSLISEEISLTHLKQVFEGGMLFSETKDVFLENFLTKNKKSKQLDSIISYINSQEKNHNIFFYENKDLLKSTTNAFPKALLIQNKLAKTLFQFLDNFMPGNGSYLIQLFHKTVQTTDIEIVFSLLHRHIRILLSLQETSDETDEVKKLAPWQKEKLQKQAREFSLQELLQLHTKLYEIDYKRKTGQLAASFPVCIDFFLLELYH